MPESRVARADRKTAALMVRVGEEIRTARMSSGLTLTEVSHATGISRSEASRIERGESPWLDVATLSRVAAVVGMDMWIRLYPGPEPLRDHSHNLLGDAFRPLVASPLVIRSEVRVGDTRDLRAWDMTLTDPMGERCGVELETRFVDAQAQHRRIARKLEDSDIDRVLVVVADTRANRSAVRAAAGLLGTAYAIDDAGAIQALRSGRLPPRSALIFLPLARHEAIDSRPTGAGDLQRPRRGAASRGTGCRARKSRGTGRFDV
jgi:transcriptional regulator with XRE-family HTH domain